MVLLLNFYTFSVIKAVTANWQPRNKMIFHTVYWVIAILVLLCFVSFWFVRFDQFPRPLRAIVFSLCIAFVLSQLLASVFFIMDDIRRLVLWIAGAVGRWKPENMSAATADGENTISRSMFLSWLGLGIGGTLFSTFVYGMSNKYDYQVRRVKLSFANLPAAFRGLKLVQISDIHSGSLDGPSHIQPGIDLINREEADVVVFTGDIVNDMAEEMLPYVSSFAQIKSKMGVYSIFGNHDYGDYKPWNSPAEKQANIQQLRNIHGQMGWKLLWDEHVILEKDGEKIGIVGVQNISGRGSFHSYGSLFKANNFTEEVPFKILLSHDPSHWDAEVLKQFSDIDLTLSGHTHGMQFGVEIPGLRWSPVQWVYKQWAGLYETGHQKLYVNRGYGFIGYPGRVGILPEITVFEFV